MKPGIWAATLSLLLLAGGCRVHDPCSDCWVPPTPGGVYSVTGDGYIEIFWDDLYIQDLDGYRVYRSDREYGDYLEIGWSTDTHFIDDNVLNGVTYFYAVTAVDYSGNESELSYETVFDTPRPEGFDLMVEDYDALAGVDFSGYYDDMIQPWDDPFADMFLFWNSSASRYAFASTEVQIGDQVFGTDIQYAGYVESLDEIDWAPEGGWTPEEADEVDLYQGHAYLVWTWDNHFAKFRVTEIGQDYVLIDWAYQVDEGNPELDVLSGGNREEARVKSPRSGGYLNSLPPARGHRRPLLNASIDRR